MVAKRSGWVWVVTMEMDFEGAQVLGVSRTIGNAAALAVAWVGGSKFWHEVKVAESSGKGRQSVTFFTRDGARIVATLAEVR